MQYLNKTRRCVLGRIPISKTNAGFCERKGCCGIIQNTESAFPGKNEKRGVGYFALLSKNGGGGET
jgi:hypothetical protein